MWLGALFSIMCLASLYQQKMGPLPDGYSENSYLSITPFSVDALRTKAVQCLVLAEYTKCPPYTLETLLCYFVSEYFHYDGLNVAWFLLGLIVRTAIRMGYHRDPSRFPNISPFEGEMRRRVWLIIIHLDAKAATEMGLPRMIQKDQYDTKEPRNLLDKDFGENSLQIPPSRDDSRPTIMLYILTR
jgi:hypothetical protein